MDGDVLHGNSPVWTNLKDRLLVSREKREAVDDMVGRGVSLPLDREHTLYIPMDWSFCRPYQRVARKLPIGAMGGSRLSVTVTTRPLSVLVVPDDGSLELGPNGSLRDPTLLCTYYLVTEQERLAMMTSEQAILLEQVQETMVENYSIDANEASKDLLSTLTVQLPFTRPTKCLIWTGCSEAVFPPLPSSACFSNVTLLYGSTQRFTQEPSADLTRKQCHPLHHAAPGDEMGLYSYALDPSALQPSGYAELGAVSSPVLRLGMSTDAPTVVWVWGLTYNVLRVVKRRAYLLLA